MAPVVPFLPAIGQGVGTLFGGLKARKAGKQAEQATSPEGQLAYLKAMGFDPEQVKSQFGDLAGLQTGAGRQFMTTFSDLMSGKSPLFAAPQDYYTKLLSGDTATRRQALAGTLSDIDIAGQGQRGQLMRGVSDRALMGTQLGRLSRDIFREKARAVTGLESKGAEGLANIGQVAGGLGMQAGNLALGGFQGAGQSYSDMFRSLIGGMDAGQGQGRLRLGGQNQAWGQQREIGRGIWDLLRAEGEGTVGSLWEKLLDWAKNKNKRPWDEQPRGGFGVTGSVPPFVG